MFKFLKEKLKGAISRLTKKAEAEVAEEAEEKAEEKKEEIKKLEEEKRALEKEERKIEREIKKAKEREKGLKEKKAEKPKKIEKKEKREKAEEIREEAEEREEIQKKWEEIGALEKKEEEIKKEEKEIGAEEKEAEKEKGFFARLREKVTKTTISPEGFEKLFWDLEVALLENNVAVEVIDKIKEDLRKNLVEKPIPRRRVQETITESLKESIKEVLSAEGIDIIKAVREKKEMPYVVCFIGVNGSGKTTSIAKVAKYLQNNGISCVIAAADTFRAAAIDQLQKHADNLNVKLIRYDYGADAAAVAFDAIKHAKAKSVNAVLIDTAGRMHSNINLMDEMKKIVRVAKPDLKVFVGESIVGNDCIEQAKQFNEAVGIDAIILSKVDVDEKGGAAISISYVTKKPIIFVGTGQRYEDLKIFRPGAVLESLGLG